MIEWIRESESLPPIAERVLLAHPRQSGEVWDVETVRLLIRHEDVQPRPIEAGKSWPTDYYWARGDRQDGSVLITGNGWWARLDHIPLPPGAEHAYGPAALGGGHYVRQLGDVFIPQQKGPN